METKISMKTIYLLLVISLGLVGLGIGSTFAMFTANIEISNPISFTSSLNYNDDVLELIDVTISANSSEDVNFAVFNNDYIAGVNYAVWYSYNGDDDDLDFTVNMDYQDSSSIIGTLSTDEQTLGNCIYITVTNNTSNDITLTMGVITSTDDIVFPSYMNIIPYYYTVQVLVEDGQASSDTQIVVKNYKYTFTFPSQSIYLNVSCTNDQIATYEVNNNYQATLTIENVTNDTFCNVSWGT